MLVAYCHRHTTPKVKLIVGVGLVVVLGDAVVGVVEVVVVPVNVAMVV